MDRRLTARIALFLGSVCLVGVAAEAKAESLQSVTVISMEEIDPAVVRRFRRELQRDCRRVLRNRHHLERVLGEDGLDFERTLVVARSFWTGDDGCLKAPELAVSVLEYTVGSAPLEYPNHLHILIEYLEGLSRPQDQARILELRRLQWLTGRGNHDVETLGFVQPERLAYLARDDVWAYVEARGGGGLFAGNAISMLFEGLLEPASPRHDFERAFALIETGGGEAQVFRAIELLEGRADAAAFAPRVETMLWRLTPLSAAARARLFGLVAPRFASTQGEAHDRAADQLAMLTVGGGDTALAAFQMVLPWYAHRLESADAREANAAARDLATFHVRFGEEAMAVLEPWLVRKLHGSNEDRSEAIAVLWPLQRAGKPAAMRLLAQFDRERREIREGGQLTLQTGPIRLFLTPTDYPSRARREEREGLVSLSVLIEPDGRVSEATVVSVTDGNDDLAEAARGAAQRRLRGLAFPNQGARSVRATLPLIQFRIGNCDGDPLTPEVPGALVVTSECVPPPPPPQMVY